MILDIIIIFITALLRLFAVILTPLNFFPPEIAQAIGNFFGNFAYLHGFLPIVPVPEMSGLVATVGILTVFGWMIKFIVYFYIVKLILWLFGFIPFFKHKSMPRASK